MKITDIRIIPFDTSAFNYKTRAFAEIELDGILTIKGIRIIESSKGGLFLGMPSVKTTKGAYKPMIVIKDKKFESYLRHHILDAFRQYGRNITIKENSENDIKTQ